MSRTFKKELIAGLQEQLKQELDAAEAERRLAADGRVSVRQHDAAAVEHDERAAQFRELLRFADPANAAAYADPQTAKHDLSKRAALIAGVRELLDFVEETPDFPTGFLREFTIYPHEGSAVADEMEVDRLARILGVPSGREAPNRHYRAERAFGPDKSVTLELCETERTDTSWKTGDPYPDWWPTEQSIEAARQHVDAASGEALDEGMGEAAADPATVAGAR